MEDVAHSLNDAVFKLFLILPVVQPQTFISVVSYDVE